MANKGHRGFQAAQAAKKKIMFGKSAVAAKVPAAQAAPAPVDPASVMPGQATPPPARGALSDMPSKGGRFGGSGGM